ncbi:MAG: hypothetical protein LBU25_01055 [Treponema sp.]|jgi:homocitrate synthase NifV|nr:hypothetical protein [Treponema sp.]
MKARRFIIDTTLRDGEQTPGCVFSPKEKIRLAGLLESAGVYQIEAGIPAMGKGEKDTMLKIMENRKGVRIAAWNRMNRADIIHSFDCRPDSMHISVPVSTRHIYSKLGRDKQWLTRRLLECVSLVKDRGYDFSIGFEDASRGDLSFMRRLVKMLEPFCPSMIRYADTLGLMGPSAIRRALAFLAGNTAIPLGIHAHNDLGMAAANSLSAAKAGALYIDTTLFGIGERAGNCDMGLFIKGAHRLFHIRPSPEEAAHLERVCFGEATRTQGINRLTGY